MHAFPHRDRHGTIADQMRAVERRRRACEVDASDLPYVKMTGGVTRSSVTLGCRTSSQSLHGRLQIILNGYDLPADHVKAIEHRDGAGCSVQIEHRGTPLALYDVASDVDAGYRRQ